MRLNYKRLSNPVRELTRAGRAVFITSDGKFFYTRAKAEAHEAFSRSDRSPRVKAAKLVPTPPSGKRLPKPYKVWLAQAEKLLLDDFEKDGGKFYNPEAWGPALWSEVVPMYESAKWASSLGQLVGGGPEVMDIISSTYPMWVQGLPAMSAAREWERMAEANHDRLYREWESHMDTGPEPYDPDAGDPYGFDTEDYARSIEAGRRNGRR